MAAMVAGSPPTGISVKFQVASQRVTILMRLLTTPAETRKAKQLCPKITTRSLTPLQSMKWSMHWSMVPLPSLSLQETTAGDSTRMVFFPQQTTAQLRSITVSLSSLSTLLDKMMVMILILSLSLIVTLSLILTLMLILTLTEMTLTETSQTLISMKRSLWSGGARKPPAPKEQTTCASRRTLSSRPTILASQVKNAAGTSTSKKVTISHKSLQKLPSSKILSATGPSRTLGALAGVIVVTWRLQLKKVKAPLASTVTSRSQESDEKPLPVLTCKDVLTIANSYA